ncbi:hypothetical protein ACROYT_G039865 [Oculina patagonica]
MLKVLNQQREEKIEQRNTANDKNESVMKMLHSDSNKESNNSPDEKRSKSGADEVFEAINMVDALGVKIEAILKKLEKLDVIEVQLNDVHTRMANIEETISRLDSEVKVVKNQQKKLKKNVEELQEGMEYAEDDISDSQRDNKKLENDVYELKKQLMYMENY